MYFQIFYQFSDSISERMAPKIEVASHMRVEFRYDISLLWEKHNNIWPERWKWEMFTSDYYQFLRLERRHPIYNIQTRCTIQYTGIVYDDVANDKGTLPHFNIILLLLLLPLLFTIIISLLWFCICTVAVEKQFTKK